MSTQNGRYGPAFKFKVVVETLRAEGSGVEVELARAYGIHPVTLSGWKRRFLEREAVDTPRNPSRVTRHGSCWATSRWKTVRSSPRRRPSRS